MFHLEAVAKGRSDRSSEVPGAAETAQRLLSVLPSFLLVHI